MRFRELRKISLFDLLKHSIQSFSAHNMTTYAAALAFNAIFALFPFLIFLITVLGFLHIPQFFDWLLDQARTALPAESYKMVENVITEVEGKSRGGVLSLSIVLAIWGASSGIRSLMTALNAAMGIEETRSPGRRYALSVIYTLGLAALLTASAALMLLGPRAIEWVADQAGLGSQFITVWTWLRWPVLTLLLLVTTTSIYALAPNTKRRHAFISPGAVLAVALWLVASIGFSLYVSHFGKYSATYGSLGGMVVLLLYFYLSSAVLLFGAEVDAQLQRLESQAPTTPNDP